VIVLHLNREAIEELAHYMHPSVSELRLGIDVDGTFKASAHQGTWSAPILGAKLDNAADYIERYRDTLEWGE
jgi:hypothetical protein